MQQGYKSQYSDQRLHSKFLNWRRNELSLNCKPANYVSANVNSIVPSMSKIKSVQNVILTVIILNYRILIVNIFKIWKKIFVLAPLVMQLLKTMPSLQWKKQQLVVNFVPRWSAEHTHHTLMPVSWLLLTCPALIIKCNRCAHFNPNVRVPGCQKLQMTASPSLAQDAL